MRECIRARTDAKTSFAGGTARWLSGSALVLAAAAGQAQVADTGGIAEIIVTAQRQAQSLQDVPIAITAFSSDAIERQQINNTSDLQLALPNVSFTKGNFTGSNFTIRGVGDAAVAASGDTSLGIHVNDQPLSTTRLFETDYFDLERIEVLRGPQGTLFGRNATSGVLNFITARPDLDALAARGLIEYGNYDSLRLEGMVNLPVTKTIGLRFAGTYLKRDGFTENLYTGNRIDGRDQWAARGTLRWQPSDQTVVDIIGYVFREDSNRSRIQKQLCNRDPTGVLGCLPDRLDFGTLNGNATLGGTITSREFYGAISGGALAPFGIGSIYGRDAYSLAVNPRNLRQVAIDYEPTYRSEETLIQFKGQQDLGDNFTLNVTGGWQETGVRSRTDYNLAVGDPLNFGPGGGIFNLRNTPFFAAGAARLFQGNAICVSAPSRRYVGFINNEIERCAGIDTNFDESGVESQGWSVEAHIDSKFDGRFNFLLGAIYLRGKVTNSDYFVNSASLDYGSVVLGFANGGPLSGLASPFFNSETDLYRLKSYGIFGEVYFDLTENLRFTGGVRYSNDDKFVRDRQFLFNLPVPYGTADFTQTAIFKTAYDADPSRPGAQPFREASTKFDAVTGRAVIDWRPDTSWSEDTLIYFSYSRGYKSGGINPPFDPTLFTAPAIYQPEFINAFEVGTKNTFLNGQLRANLTGFYYDYKGLQLSRIINRTSFNDNTDATIYGLEGEFVVAPTPRWLFNISASLLHTKVKELALIDVRDPSGGVNDAVIIKDLAGGANCVFRVPGNPTLANAFVAGFNAAVGLRPPVPVPATNTTGAFSLCNALRDAALGAGIPVVVEGNNRTLPAGVPVNLDGNELPNAPSFKIALGGQYTLPLGSSGWSATLRADYSLTDEFYSRTFNRPIDRVPSYQIVNAQLQVNAPDNRWFIRGFIQNALNSDAITGQYITDPSSGLFTNIFTLEPRRYGIAAGLSF
ncbi:TonB-dependent receptor [Thermaurantiacus sp.]